MHLYRYSSRYYKACYDKSKQALKEQNLKSRLILQVHDELLVETAVDEIDIVKDILTKGMKEAASLRVPLEIDIKQGNNWLEAH